jgi:alpha-beta hydrolase superfamily lysophospholipase
MPARTAQEGAGNLRGHYDHSATWSGVILSGSTALDLLAAAMANAPADAPTWPTPHNSCASAATCTSSSHPATQTRWVAGGVLLQQLGQQYRDTGVADVTVRLYPATRHEILNKTNQDEVMGDVVGWLRELV